MQLTAPQVSYEDLGLPQDKVIESIKAMLRDIEAGKAIVHRLGARAELDIFGYTQVTLTLKMTVAT